MSALINKLLGESEGDPSTLDLQTLLRGISGDVDAEDYESALARAEDLVVRLRKVEVKRRASSDKAEPLASYIKKAVAYFKEKGWSEDDVEPLRAASSVEELVDEVREFAEDVGSNKGWGEEGVGELWGEMLAEIDPELVSYQY